MMQYSVPPRHLIFVKSYGYLTFAKNMGKNIVKNTSKNLRFKYSQKLLYHTKQSETDTLLSEPFRKTAESTGNFVGKIADRITKVSRNSLQNNSETSTNEYDK